MATALGVAGDGDSTVLTEIPSTDATTVLPIEAGVPIAALVPDAGPPRPGPGFGWLDDRRRLAAVALGGLVVALALFGAAAANRERDAAPVTPAPVASIPTAATTPATTTTTTVVAVVEPKPDKGKKGKGHHDD